jgi:hypothetical protein
MTVTRQEVEQAFDADTADYNPRIWVTIEDAEEAEYDSPLTEALRRNQHRFDELWKKRGTDPIQQVVAEYAH